MAVRTHRSVPVLASLVLVLVVLQFFYAGWAVLVQPGHWGMHVNIGHSVGYAIMALIAACLISRAPRRVSWLSVLLFVLYMGQYVWLDLPLHFDGAAINLRALHAVNALAIFALAYHVAALTWRSPRKDGIHAATDHSDRTDPRPS